MSHPQLVCLVAYLDLDPVLQSKNGKPQACPLYQIGVFIYRMAHGHTLNVIERTFQVSSLSFPSAVSSSLSEL